VPQLQIERIPPELQMRLQQRFLPRFQRKLSDLSQHLRNLCRHVDLKLPELQIERFLRLEHQHLSMQQRIHDGRQWKLCLGILPLQLLDLLRLALISMHILQGKRIPQRRFVPVLQRVLHGWQRKLQQLLQQM
jgi:hypothetical protein